MKLEPITLSGNPVVIAPEAIFLVGDPGLPWEEVAVLAAISDHATAQYLPNVVPASPLLATVVRQAKSYLGESAAALPAGSVLLTPRPPQGGEETSYGTTPAIAVATTAAVFETAGQSIGERGDEILLVAEAAHRALYQGIRAEGELAAAQHGGLVKVIFQAGAAPRIEDVPVPADLSLVVFRTGQPLYPDGWPASVQLFAERAPSAYGVFLGTLTELATAFATELADGNVTGALASAADYGRCITQLAAAASAPLQSESLLQAIELAEALGGIAKSSSASRNDLGIAMFATPEAANEFVSGCQDPLIPLSIELDRLGVRYLLSEPTADPGGFYSATTVVRPSRTSIQAIARSFAVDDGESSRSEWSAPTKVDPPPAAAPEPESEDPILELDGIVDQSAEGDGAEAAKPDKPVVDLAAIIKQYAWDDDAEAAEPEKPVAELAGIVEQSAWDDGAEKAEPEKPVVESAGIVEQSAWDDGAVNSESEEPIAEPAGMVEHSGWDDGPEEAEPAAPALPCAAAPPPRKSRRIGPAIGGVLVVAALLAVWLTKAIGRHDPPRVAGNGTAVQVPPLPLPLAPELPPPTQDARNSPPSEEAATPVVLPSDPQPRPQSPPVPDATVAPSGRSKGKSLAAHGSVRPVRSHVSPSVRPAGKRLAHNRAVPRQHAKSPRAGTLSPDDF